MATDSSTSASTSMGSTSIDSDVGFPLAVATASSAVVSTLAPVVSSTMPITAPASTSPPVLLRPAPAPAPLSSPSSSPPSSSNTNDHKYAGKLPPPTSGPNPNDDCKSSSKSESPEAQLARKRTTGTCAFYPSKFKECAEPRSCFDCLNFVVQGEDGGCMLTEYGRCEPARKNYCDALDYTHFTAANAIAHANASSNNSNNATVPLNAVVGGDSSNGLPTTKQPTQKGETWAQFRASTTKYCDRADAACKECRRSVFADYMEDASRRGGNAFCVGTNGCVCVAVCEARRDRPQPPNKDCYVKALAAQSKKETDVAAGTNGMTSVVAMLGAMLFVVATVFAIYRVRTRGERRRRRRRRRSRNNSADSIDGATTGGANGDTAAHDVATPLAGASPGNTVMVTVTSTTGAQLLDVVGWHTQQDIVDENDDDDRVHKDVDCTASTASPHKHVPLQFVSMEPSAPDMDAAMPMAIPVGRHMASAPLLFSVRATASAPDFDDLDGDVDYCNEVLL